jgi:glycerol-3-phosphate dehydrogenase (NAD(P)+)
MRAHGTGLPSSPPSAPGDALLVHHERIRRRGISTPVYWLTRAVLQPFIHVYFRLRRTGHAHIPAEGPVILAANHRSFLDPFVIGCCVRRPIYFMAKRELFEKRLQGWFLNALGAFPLRRGESDEESVTTARAVLDRGDVVVIFPEGTRIREGSLARPKRGVGRLALETGVPVVPVAVAGTERARRGWRIRPCRVSVRYGRPLTFPRVANPSQALAAEVTARIWPCVELQWEWLGGLPPLRKAAVVGAGSMGTAVAVLLARAGLEVQLGCRTARQAERVAARAENVRHLPGIPLDPAIAVSTVADIEFAGVDLVVFAVPCASLPAAVGRVGARIGQRSAVLVVSKGLVPPLGTTPSRYVADRVVARAIACLGGPAHAQEAVKRGASVVLATHDRDLGRQLRERTDDVIGTELAACAKNAAALAAAAAGESGPNLAGAAAGRVFAELHQLALSSGGLSETFAGVAGTGDLVATSLAEGSRNRRAGELLGRGVPADQIAAIVDQTAEALGTVPLLELAFEREGVEAPVTARLAAVIEGRASPEEWRESVRSASGGATRRAA